MAKTHQVMDICDYGNQYKVIRFYGTENPYRIYRITREIGQYGYPTEHRKLIVAYANLHSCFCWFAQNNIGL